MNESQLKARKTRIMNNLQKTDKRTTYEKQYDKRKLQDHIETVKRID